MCAEAPDLPQQIQSGRLLHAGNNFYFLLAGLLVILVALPVGAQTFPQYAFVIVLAGFPAALITSLWTLGDSRRRRFIGAALATLSVLLAATALALGEQSSVFPLLSLGTLATVAFFFTQSIAVAARVVLFSSAAVTINRITGAVCIYFMLAIDWAVAYSIIDHLYPGSFNGIVTQLPGRGFDDYLYFSFVTLTTLGYGEITPAGPLVRALAYLEATAGVLYLAVLVAALLGAFFADRAEQAAVATRPPPAAKSRSETPG